ncbi:membrane glycoprotein US2 [Cynomolgus macaque cytomegalovirus strain Ottawa]|uniref:Membrane glycoprotein US2 n=1 Tax=macacine betaherpesvirus 8 TaxID=2560567 RepID=G8H0V3_9BETA|nr:membrane glycoprotein US2 [Cynomolgus macaque cytomegalovirus strain Ottawa]AEQ32301.1 membrane glycoprotein US2 [Cynomolgus macaque cytomegalovirus strain Ottawa]
MAVSLAILVLGGVALQIGLTFGWDFPIPELTEEQLAARRALYTVRQTACYLEGGKLFMKGYITGNIDSYLVQVMVNRDKGFEYLRFFEKDIKLSSDKLEYDLRYYEIDWTTTTVNMRFSLNISDEIWIMCEPHVKPDFLAHDYFWTMCRAYWFKDWWLILWCVLVTVAHFMVCAVPIMWYVFQERTLKVFLRAFMC